MARTIKKQASHRPQPGTKHKGFGHKHVGCQLPLPLWQDLKVEANRRKILGLTSDSLQEIAVRALEDWLQHHKGKEE